MPVKTLNDFISNIKKEGLARQNRFTVTIAGQNNPLVHLFCEQAILPSLSLASAPVRTWGESREAVYDRNFESATFSFLVDTNMEVKKYFDQWMDDIIDPTTRIVSYYDTYVQDIYVQVQDTKDNDTYQVILYDAYPKTIGAINLDNNSKDTMKIQVTFNYKYHINEQKITHRDESETKGGFNLPDPYKISRQLGSYLKGSISNTTAGQDLYFSNFNQYQQNLNDSLSVTRAIERQSFETGTGSSIG